MSASVVVVTHLSLLDIANNSHGIYQRFRVLLESATKLSDRVVVVCCGTPARDSNGKSSSENAERQLSDGWGLNVKVECLDPRPLYGGPWIAHQILAIFGFRFHSGPYQLIHPAAQLRLSKIVGADVKLVIAHRLTSMTLAALVCSKDIPLIFDLDDLEHIAQWRMAQRERSIRQRFLKSAAVLAFRRAERKAVTRATKTLVCSEVDAAKAKAIWPAGTYEVLSNSVFIPSRVPELTRAPVLLMVGVYSYEPNADAADFFLQHVWPRVRGALPTAELRFAGANPHCLKQYDAHPAGVKFLGFVPDLAAVYADARLVICPIRTGGGTRIKILEAGAYGRPIVSTPVGAEGLQLKQDAEILLADDPEQFAAHCVSVLRDDSLAERLGQNARLAVTKRYSRDSVIQSFCQMVSGLAASR